MYMGEKCDKAVREKSVGEMYMGEKCDKAVREKVCG